MSIVIRQFNKKETGTVFRHAVSGKLSCRIEPKVTQDDWMLLHGLLSLVYHAGINTGSEQRAAEIREVLGVSGRGRTEKIWEYSLFSDG